MAWEVTDEEFEEVRRLSPLERYTYFMERVLEHEEVWVLVQPEDDQVGLVEDPEEGVVYMMAWPHERFAGAERERDWEAHEPKPFTLEEWLGVVLPTLVRDGVSVGVFPVWDRGVWALGADELREEFLHALGAGDGG